MKRTYQPNNRKRAKTHGFFARKEGNVLNKRRAKKEKDYVQLRKNKEADSSSWYFLLWVI